VTSTEAHIAPQPPALDSWNDAPRRGRGFSLRTLIVLRWLTIVGQSAAILTAYGALHFPLPLWPCLIVIAVSAAVNVAAMARVRRLEASLPDGRQTALHLGFDIFQLGVLLALTGGLENPFCLLLVAPVTIAAAALPARQALLLGLLALVAVATLFFWSEPLPWRPHENFHLPTLYRFGMALALVTGVVFTAGYAWRVAADAEKLELALATTQDVLQREQRLAALGGLAAAAAHELGTPLATIQVVAKEMKRAAPPGGELGEDAELILQQADRCRGILAQLSQQPEGDDALYADVGLKALLEEVVQPHRGFDLAFEIAVRTPPGQPAPRVRRMPEVVHGLSALVENAADFARSRVEVRALVDAGWIEVEIMDDGPGFSGDILPRLGEPYVTSRPQGKARQALAAQITAAARRRPPAEAPIAPSQGGMGLGFFIARTLLERTGGAVSVGQGLPQSDARGASRGARVAVRWSRSALEVAE
jgi:two-component system sensor histidine kinase RegB